MYDELKRLNFEDFIWFLFATLAFLNIFGNYNSKEYIITNNEKYKYKSSKIFEFTLTITLLIYGYFFIRNYNSFINVSNNNKELYMIKLLGTSFLIAGIVCLIYFQIKQDSFLGSPAL